MNKAPLYELLIFCYLLQNSEVKRRKRRRVLKSNTFLDDEGCIGRLQFIEDQKLINNMIDVW